MIVKMKLISLTGPVSDLDCVVDQYLSRYDINLENALTELGDVRTLVPFSESNPYQEPLQKLNGYADLLSQTEVQPAAGPVDLDHAMKMITCLDGTFADKNRKKEEIGKEVDEIARQIETLTPFKMLPADLSKLLQYHFIDFRFGRIPRDFFEKFNNYIYDNFDTVFIKCQQTESDVWGVYFTPASESHKIDAVYSSMHFERIYVPGENAGTPEQMIRSLEETKKQKEDQIRALDREMETALKADAPLLLAARDRLAALSGHFDVRKMAAIMKTHSEDYYILCGWMAEDDVKKFQAEIANDDRAVCVIEDTDPDDKDLTPPTLLKNPRLFKPYEMYVQMYGLPNYRELDPTIFIALTYSFIFGAMFGDWGQGLVLLIGGALLYHFRHIKLAGIISCAGIFSTIFGLLFGSFFGFEDTIVRHLWLKPKEATMTLPGIGTINTVLVCAIVFGMFLILVTMVLNIINARRLRDRENEWFGTNSVAGLLFYTGVVIFIIHAFSGGQTKLGTWFIVLFFAIPLILMFFREPLTGIIERRKGPKVEGGAVMFIVQSFFEMFEVLLSFFSNTLSFVRIGAFAVSHAAMMEVVLMLAGAEAGHPNWIAVVLGNLFVMGMEGLIVGIQVLRLEYYEMFSRFYKGDGRPFRSFFKQTKDET
jgi:V/A-type H+-transporting ATPase subunit I